MTDRKARVIARVVVGQPPATIRTIEEWRAWRAAENERMVEAIAAQLDAQGERDAGATEH